MGWRYGSTHLKPRCKTSPTLTKSKVRRYLLNGGLTEPQKWSEWLGEEKNLMPLPGIELQLLRCPAHSPVTIPTTLLRHLPGNCPAHSPVTIPTTLLRHQVKNIHKKCCSIPLYHLNKQMIITSVSCGYFMPTFHTQNTKKCWNYWIRERNKAVHIVSVVLSFGTAQMLKRSGLLITLQA
jgi:hypothetical protein